MNNAFDPYRPRRPRDASRRAVKPTCRRAVVLHEGDVTITLAAFEAAPGQNRTTSRPPRDARQLKHVSARQTASRGYPSP